MFAVPVLLDGVPLLSMIWIYSKETARPSILAPSASTRCPSWVRAMRALGGMLQSLQPHLEVGRCHGVG